MKSSSNPPIYEQVAFDIAKKIAAGTIAEKERLSGRSLLAAQYGVSSETIRRAMRCLADAGVVETQDNVGSTVVSQGNAVSYTEKFQLNHNARYLKREMHRLIEQRNRLNDQILELMDRITDLNGRFAESDLLRNYEFTIPSTSSLMGKSVGESGFWQNTGGTIVAIRRGEEILLSPGPHVRFQAEDVLVVAGLPGIVPRVQEFIS